MRWPRRGSINRGILAIALLWLLAGMPIFTSGRALANGAWTENRFTTGCQPGPYALYEGGDPPIWAPPSPPDPPEDINVAVDLASFVTHPTLLGTGLNMENALWSCPAYQAVFARDLVAPFKPAIARIDTGLLPAAPAELSAGALGPSVYRSVLSSPQYAESWEYMRELNRDGIRVVLGVWGGPAQFTKDGTRLGVLRPEYYDAYVEYVTTLVDYLAREQGVSIWAITIANEPDGGDGNRIPPAGFAYIAHRLALQLEPLGVLLYGPDTGSAAHALDYLPAMLVDPVIVAHLAFVGIHSYAADSTVRDVVNLVHSNDPGIPVIVTEYTSFSFGDLDAGQGTSDYLGFTLDVVNTLMSHYANGADAAIYWDAVDYMQPGHNALTRWGLLRSPASGFQMRLRYFGLQQVLAYITPGSRVLDIDQEGGHDVRILAVRTPDGGVSLFLDNYGTGTEQVNLTLTGESSVIPSALAVTRTDRTLKAAVLGQLPVLDGVAGFTLPGLSITTLSTESPVALPVGP